MNLAVLSGRPAVFVKTGNVKPLAIFCSCIAVCVRTGQYFRQPNRFSRNELETDFIATLNCLVIAEAF